jgi:hypothetical protein
MTKDTIKSKQERLREIEDRKIELLQKTANMNKEYSDKILNLDSEYRKLDKEYYSLKLNLIKQKSK